MIEKCNCGRPAKWSSGINEPSSCNKHKLCPTYDEIEKELELLKSRYSLLLSHAETLTLYKDSSSRSIASHIFINAELEKR